MKKTNDVDLYQITNLNTFEKGTPFGLCQKCFEKWEAKDRVLWNRIGRKTTYPCNECGKNNPSPKE